MIKKHIPIVDANILIMGLTFKENCPDIRNTRTLDLVKKLKNLNCKIDLFDPWVDKSKVKKIFGMTPLDQPLNSKYDVIIITVAHNEFKKLSTKQIHAFGKKNHVLYDIVYMLGVNEVDGRL